MENNSHHFGFDHKNNRESKIILSAIHDVKSQIHELKNLINFLGGNLMSKLDSYVDSSNKKLDAMSQSIDGIVADIKDLKDQLSNEDISDEAAAKLDALDQKAGALSDRLSALDQENPAQPAPVAPSESDQNKSS